jgi:ketosteroid isomerase-like protein
VSENADIARRGFEAFSRGDLDGCLATIHPEIEWHLAFRLPDLPPDKTVFRGHDEVSDLWAAFRSVWEEMTLEIQEILFDRDDTVIVRCRFAARGGTSGAEVDRIVYYVQVLRDKRLIRNVPFDTAEEAFAYAGVEP